MQDQSRKLEEILRSPVEVGSLSGFIHPRWLAGSLPSALFHSSSTELNRQEFFFAASSPRKVVGS